MNTRFRVLLALLVCLAVAGMSQVNQPPVPEHSAAEVAVGGPMALSVMLMVVGMLAVFLGLFGIYLFLICLRRFSETKAPVVSVPESESGALAGPIEITAEMASAIALALYMDLRTFDEGTAQEVTIRKITRPFSPWWNAAKTQILFDKVEMFRRKY